MESLKKIITLKQAAELTGYNQDYLGYLVRNGEIKAKKVGRNWMTTEQEIQSFIFRQKVRSGNMAVKDFVLSRRRLFAIFTIASIVFLFCLSVMYKISEAHPPRLVEAHQALSSGSDL